MNTAGNLDSLKKYLVPLIAVVGVVVLVPLLIMPSVTDIQTDYQQSQSQQTLSKQLDEKITKLSQLNNQDYVQKLNQYLEPAIPSDPDPAGLLGSMEQLAFASGATAKSSTYASSAATQSGDSGEISATVVIEGPYANIANFVAQTEKASRIVSIKTMKLSVPSTGGNTVSAVFEISSPYENVSNLGAPETPLPTDMTGSQIYNTITGLTRAAYSPTPATQIAGKDNPF